MRFGLIKVIIIVQDLMIFNLLMIIKIMMRLLPVFVSNNGIHLTIRSSCKLISKLVQMVNKKIRVNLNIVKFGLNINFTWLL
jgi:hypothetical protein